MLQEFDLECDSHFEVKLGGNESIRFKVPTFPARKQPGSTLSLASISSGQGGGSTQDSLSSSKASARDSATQISHVFQLPQDTNGQDKQILSMITTFKQALGIARQKLCSILRRELECKIIRNLTNQKKQFDQQDQYMICMSWVKEYTSYLYDNDTIKPSKLNNSLLFEDASKKIYKRNLVLNTDYAIVNDVVWIFLKQEYQGGPEVLYEAYQQQTNNQNKPNTLTLLNTLNETTTKGRAKSVEPTSNSAIPSNNHQKVNYEIPLLGFKNEQYYCYMNSGLQSLLSLPDFNYFFMKILKYHYREQLSKKLLQHKLPTTLAYLEMIEQVRYNESKEHVKVGTLRDMMCKKFSPRQQHDCQEFVLHLLSVIEDELSALFKEVNKMKNVQKYFDVNMVQYLFKGSIESKVVCSNKGCQHVSANTETFLTLSLALKAKTLEECLDEFFKDERVKDYKCDKCKQNNTLKQTQLSSQPKHIIFHVKRFKFFPKHHKIASLLQFPLDGLSLKKYLTKSQHPEILYKLRALVVHQGSLDSGHYYCFGRRFHQVTYLLISNSGFYSTIRQCKEQARKISLLNKPIYYSTHKTTSEQRTQTQDLFYLFVSQQTHFQLSKLNLF